MNARCQPTQKALQPLEHAQIEVVCWLVQHQQIRFGEQRFGERNACLCPPLSVWTDCVNLLRIEAESGQDIVSPVLDVVAAGDFELETSRSYSAKYSSSSSPSADCISSSSSRMRACAPGRPKRQASLVPNVRSTSKRDPVQDRHARAARNRNLARVRHVSAGDDLEQGGFSGAVDANQRNVLTVSDLE